VASAAALFDWGRAALRRAVRQCRRRGNGGAQIGNCARSILRAIANVIIRRPQRRVLCDVLPQVAVAATDKRAS